MAVGGEKKEANSSNLNLAFTLFCTIRPLSHISVGGPA